MAVIASGRSSTSSPEYLAFRKNYELAIENIKLQPGYFCDALFGKGYIPADVRDYVRTVGITDTDKARKLADIVIDRIGYNPSVFHGFLELLNKPSIEDFLYILQESFKAKQQSLLFPYLKLPLQKANDDKAIIDMQDQLISVTMDIISKFADLSLQIGKSLENRQVSLQTIKHCVLSLQAFSGGNKVTVIGVETKEKINAAMSIFEVFSILHVHNYISFFNYLILQHVVKCCGSADDNSLLEEYLAFFHGFCQRNVFEVPPLTFFFQLCSANRVMAFRCVEGIIILEEVHTLRQKIAQVLGLQPSALLLWFITAEEDCVDIYFSISNNSIADCILPVSLPQDSALRRIGVIVLPCGTVKLMVKDRK